MTVLVTGASGHLGANLVRALLDQRREVRALIYAGDEGGVRGLAIERVGGDVRDPDAVARAVAGCTGVYHLAARVSIHGGEGGLVAATNLDGTRNVVRACREHGARLVYVGSIQVFRPEPVDRPLDEHRARLDETDRPTAYMRSKVAAEQEVRAAAAAGLDAVIVHPTAIIGPHDHGPSHLGQLLLALRGRRLPALVDGGCDWVDARDVADGAIRAELHGRRGEAYVLGGRWATVGELAAHAAAVTGAPAPRWVVPYWLARAAAQLAGAARRELPLFTGEALRALHGNRAIRHDKARHELGYRPRPLAETLRATYRWFGAAAARDG